MDRLTSVSASLSTNRSCSAAGMPFNIANISFSLVILITGTTDGCSCCMDSEAPFSYIGIVMGLVTAAGEVVVDNLL